MYAAGHGIGKVRATRAGGLFDWSRRTVVVLVAVAAAGLAFGLAVQGHTQSPETTVVVQPGDTLWSIAAEHYPADDTRARVEDIERANGLSSPIIRSGEMLRLPN